LKAVWTYWSKGRSLNGFNSEEDFVKSIRLSLSLAKKYFNKTELVTDSLGEELIRENGIIFDNVVVVLDSYCKDIPEYYWAYPKIVTCSLQKEPFIHIDNDFYFYSKIAKYTLKNDIVFEIKLGIKRYNRLLETFSIVPEQINYTIGCGIMLFNNLRPIESWVKKTSKFMDLDNKDKSEVDRELSNQLFEQYTLSVILQKEFSNLSIDFLTYDTKFIHLFGSNKKSHLLEELYNQYFN